MSSSTIACRRVVALRGEAFEGHLVRMIGEVLALVPVGDDAFLDDVGLVAVVVPLVERGVGDARELLVGQSRHSRQRLPDAELFDLMRPRTTLRVRSRERVAHGVHQLVQAVPALAHPGSSVDHDLAHEVVEKVAAADERGRREAARNRGSLDVGGFGIRELRHEVEALAGVAELPPKGRVGLVGQGLGPVEEGIGRRRVGAKTRRMVAPAEAEGRREVPVVEEIPQDVGPRRLAAVPFDEGAVGERFDHDVPLAVERRGALREERREERERQPRRAPCRPPPGARFMGSGDVVLLPPRD